MLQAVPHLPGPAGFAEVLAPTRSRRTTGAARNIYDALDWGNPSGAGKLSALILFVGLPFLWILLYCVFLGRRCHRVATSESGKLPV